MPGDFRLEEHGLQRLAVSRRHGVVFASFSPAAEPLEEYLGENNLTAVTERDWHAIIGRLAPVSESYLRRLLAETGIPVEQPFAGVRQKSFEELERSLLEMEEVYTHARESGNRARVQLCRNVVIQAKDHARLAARSPKASTEKKLEKEANYFRRITNLLSQNNSTNINEKEFNELCEFVKAAEFDWMGSFSYSDQDGATAFALDGKLSLREIERRRKHLMKIQQGISKRKKKALRGKEFDVLLEGASEETDMLLEGRTAMHAPEIDGKLYISDVPDGVDPVPGEFYRCQITETHDYDLVARIV